MAVVLNAPRGPQLQPALRPPSTGAHAQLPPARLSLGRLLLNRNIVTETELDAAIAHQKRAGVRLGQALVDLGYTTADAILATLGEQLDVPTTRLNANTVSSDGVLALPEKLARKLTAFPLSKTDTTLTVALATPRDLNVLDDLRFAAGCEIQVVLALEGEIHSAIDRYYRDAWLPGADDESGGTVVIQTQTPATIKNEAAERSAVYLVERIIAKAAGEGASDIHVEPTADALRVRIRVDGVFRGIAQLASSVAPSVIARIKVLAGMDIAEHRVPQDGRFSASVGGRQLDLRSSTYPTVYGEKAVLRLLDRSGLEFHLSRLGLNPAMLERYRDVMHQPEGMVLITGPTGSGKTTTLYGTLAELSETGKNIMTIENPVEYALSGVNQGQTNDKAGFTFARGLRAILRQDPDIIMVGEIRDVETLETAVEASLTGHMVFSTLHTTSAVGTIARVMEMGLEPYMLASSFKGIVAQRLVRRICSTCKTQTTISPALKHFFREGADHCLYQGAGCSDCRGSGYRGRIGVYEFLQTTPEFCQQLLARASEPTLLNVARAHGMKTLREECLALVVSGHTTLEEVLRVTGGTSGRADRNRRGRDRTEDSPQLTEDDLTA
jgi:type IV pilus assembly protein PilB